MYRSVLLNSGPRRRPQPDTSTTTEDTISTSTTSASNTSSATSTAGADGVNETAVAMRDTPVEQLLYKPEIEVGSRGDIIQFYNKLFIGFIKDFVLKFSPNEPEVSGSVYSRQLYSVML